jgi:hypothetical protein
MPNSNAIRFSFSPCAAHPPLAEVHPRKNPDFHIKGYNGAIPVKFTNVAYPQGILETVQNRVSPASCPGSTRWPRRVLAAAARAATNFRCQLRKKAFSLAKSAAATPGVLLLSASYAHFDDAGWQRK